MQTHGGADSEKVIVGFPFAPAAQPLNLSTSCYGGFVQGAYRFGPI